MDDQDLGKPGGDQPGSKTQAGDRTSSAAESRVDSSPRESSTDRSTEGGVLVNTARAIGSALGKVVAKTGVARRKSPAAKKANTSKRAIRKVGPKKASAAKRSQASKTSTAKKTGTTKKAKR